MSVYLCTAPPADDEEPRVPSCIDLLIGAVLIAIALFAGRGLADLRWRRRP